MTKCDFNKVAFTKDTYGGLLLPLQLVLICIVAWVVALFSGLPGSKIFISELWYIFRNTRPKVFKKPMNGYLYYLENIP